MSTPAAQRPPRPLAQVLLVTGKGGVGKTTVAAGLAMLHAESRGDAVLVEFGDGQSGERALAGKHRRVQHRVIRPDEALQRGATPLFGSATLAKLALGNFAMRPLLRAAPAVRELAMLESVRQIAAEHPDARVVVDLPATGHSVAWLRVPRQGKDFLAEGPLFDMCDRVAKELLAPGRASILVVTLPEALVLEETLELCHAIERDAGMPVDRIVVNRVPTALSPRALEEARAMGASASPQAEAYRALAAVLEARAAASAAALASLDTLLHRDHTLWRLPLAAVDPTSAEVARWLRAEGAA